METAGPPDTRPAVTLDLWLTLVAESDGRQYSERRFERRSSNLIEVIRSRGLAVDEDAVLTVSRQISQLVTADHDLGIDMRFTDRVVQMLSMIDEYLPEQLGAEGIVEVANAVDSAFLELPPSFLPGAVQALERLRTEDISVALISNTGLTSADAYRQWFDQEGVTAFFDHLTFSNEVACAKPSPDIFHPTLEAMGVEPKDALHIGDNLLTDISGAAGVGMRTGWISGHDEREPIIEPDYTLSDISDLPAVVERWLEARRVFGR